MDFEYDPKKSESNKEKHGIDFEEAQMLWDSRYITIPVEHDFGEQRFIVIGTLKERCWTAVITYRGERIRIISVRRSRKNEEAFYGKED